jgi:hypothetical protein
MHVMHHKQPKSKLLCRKVDAMIECNKESCQRLSFTQLKIVICTKICTSKAEKANCTKHQQKHLVAHTTKEPDDFSKTEKSSATVSKQS